MSPAQLGRTLARSRREAGLTQAEVAARMGTDQASVSRIEGGRAYPSGAVIERFARAVGQQIPLVFGEPGPISRDARRRRVEAALGPDPFNPWDRDPAPAEVKSLLADGLTRERFERARPARSGR